MGTEGHKIKWSGHVIVLVRNARGSNTPVNWLQPSPISGVFTDSHKTQLNLYYNNLLRFLPQEGALSTL